MEKFEIKVPTNNLEEGGGEKEEEISTVLNVESFAISGLKKEFHYSEDIRKETGIEGYERTKISWQAVYDYLRNSIVGMPDVADDDKREIVIKMSKIAEIDIRFKDKELTDYRDDYHEFYVSSFKKRVDEIIRKINEYSKITNTNIEANAAVKELEELNDQLQHESDELLELRALCLKREELRAIKTHSVELNTELRLVMSRIIELVKILPEANLLERIDSCVKSLSMIIKPATEKVRGALISLLSAWSDGEFPKLTFNHILSGDVESPEKREGYKKQLFKDDLFLQQIGIEENSPYGSTFDLADGYLWDLRNSLISEPSFGFSPDDAIFIDSIKSISGEHSRSIEFITDPNVKQWLSQVKNPAHSNESGYQNWFKSVGLEGKEATNGHPTLLIPRDSEHVLRWGHAKYAVIPTEKNLNLIKLEHKSSK